MDIFFWLHMPLHHQAPSLRELAACWPGNVHALWCSNITPDRLALGWQFPDFGKVKGAVLTRDPKEEIRRIMGANSAAVHVFFGFDGYPPVSFAFRCAVSTGATRLVVMAEPGSSMGWRGRVRPLRARLIARRYIGQIRLFLAMGQSGMDYYRRAGFADEILYPYMHQCEAFQGDCSAQVRNPVRLVYVGKFIHRKGVDVMIRALARCGLHNWRLQIVGDGPGRALMQVLARGMGISTRIEWLGVQPSSRILEILVLNDVCIVPSHFEGWGVVCNEALQAGLAVICSDAAASSELVSTSQAGLIFRSGNYRDLAGRLDALLVDPERIVKMKERAAQYRWRISPQVVGRYLRDVLGHVFLGEGSAKPAPPWLEPPIHPL